jgi:hypothetical protein
MSLAMLTTLDTPTPSSTFTAGMFSEFPMHACSWQVPWYLLS